MERTRSARDKGCCAYETFRVTVLLQWCYSGVAAMFQWFHSGVTVVLQWCRSRVAKVSMRHLSSDSGGILLLQSCYTIATLLLLWGHLPSNGVEVPPDPLSHRCYTVVTLVLH
jgi:hypothetical protein